MKTNRKLLFTGLTLLLGFWVSSSSAAEQNLVESVMTGCKTELNTYCEDVTPGQKRLLACLYAHNDKLSAQCDFALFDAAIQLERAVAALSYVVNECDDDLMQFCSEEQVGEGRLLACLDKNQAEVSTRCKEALIEVGLK
jgi:hypothetical protein